ncbi:MAG: hypothetical protein JWO32_1023, partial [Bacteroidetes bacterium]|nr:hypothetical protein [Bacteroidota bacterium]
MKHTKTLLAAFLLMIVTVTKLTGQNSENDFKTAYIFSSDSLNGFDEQSASAMALANACYGKEFKVFMNREKRRFIINKYNIHIPAQQEVINYTPSVSDAPVSNGKSMVLSSGSCNNDDFEDAQTNAGPQVGGVVNGWAIFGGSTANYCAPSANGSTNTYTVFNSMTIDPIMIAPNNTIASYYDANSFNQPAGSCFIRLNNDIAGSKVVKASKTYTISPNNAVFRYAYKAVISNPNHSCCDQPGFHIKVTITNTATSQSTLMACPNISVAAGTACGPATPGFVTGNLLNGSPSSYNPNWVPGSLDLSGYIGFAVKLDVYAIDCALGGHAGYVYFDALCSPMTIVGNGQGFPAGSPSITIPTCGAAGGTLTAPPGLGPYSWNSTQISIPPGYTSPSFTNQTLITNQSGTLSLTMNPAGSCSVITKILTVTITPAPIALASATQASCTNSLSAASLTTAGSASVNPVITWSPAPGMISPNSYSATGLAVGITTISVTDNNGCQTQATLNILSTPPPVTFQVNNLSGSYSLSCINPTIDMSATTGYTYGTLSYNWSSVSFTSNGNPINLNQPGTYNVCGIDAVTSCSACQTFTIYQDFAVPTNSVNPTTQVITCNTVSAATFTSAAQNPTVNIVQNWYSPQNPYPVGPPAASTNNQFSPFVAGSPGIYTVEVCNLVNGCCNTKTVSVTSISGFPTFNTSSTTNYTLGCSSKSVTTLCMTNAVSASSAGVTYLFLPPGTPSAVPIPSSAFGASSCMSLTTPGNWTVVVNDVGNGCQTPLQVPILQNTFPPDVSAKFAPATQTLTCFNPTILATGTSSTPNTFITWIVPSTPPLLSTSTVALGPPTGPLTSPGSLFYA